MISIKKKRAFAKDHNSDFVSIASDEDSLGNISVSDDINDGVFDGFITDGTSEGTIEDAIEGAIEGATEGNSVGVADGKAIFPTVIEQPNIGNIHIVNRIIELFM